MISYSGKVDNQPAPQLFEDQIDSLDKDKAVEGTLQKQNEEQRKIIELQAK